MIERKKKICKECNTPQYIFSKGLCRMCWGKSQMKPIDTPKPSNKTLSPHKRYNIPKQTKKRALQEELYKMIIRTMDKHKDISCVFCGEKMNRPEDHHHLLGRDGELLTDKKYIKHAHRKCHSEYHDKSVLKLPWFIDFVNRVSDIDTGLAEREINKLNK